MTDYETPDDERAEAEIAAVLVEKWKLSGTGKMPKFYSLDCAAIRADNDNGVERIEAFIEIKDRSRVFGDGKGLWLSLFKVLNAHLLTGATGLPCMLVVRFLGGEIHWCFLHAYDRSIGPFWFGRNGRAAEPCVSFPWHEFKRVA